MIASLSGRGSFTEITLVVCWAERPSIAVSAATDPNEVRQREMMISRCPAHACSTAKWSPPLLGWGDDDLHLLLALAPLYPNGWSIAALGVVKNFGPSGVMCRQSSRRMPNSP